MDFFSNFKLQVLGSVPGKYWAEFITALDVVGLDFYPHNSLDDFLRATERSFFNIGCISFKELNGRVLNLLVEWNVSYVLTWQSCDEMPFGVITFSGATGKVAALSNIGGVVRDDQMANAYANQSSLDDARKNVVPLRA